MDEHGWKAITSHLQFLREETLKCESSRRVIRLMNKYDKLWFKYQYLIG